MATKTKPKGKAKPKRKTQNPLSTGTPKAAAKTPAYDWLKGRDPNELAQQASKTATSQIQPTLDNIALSTTREDSANKARTGDLDKWGRFQQDQLNNAFKEADAALQRMLGAQTTGNAEQQATLASSMRAAGKPGDSLAAMTGTSAPVGEEQQLLASAAASRSGSEQAMREQAANILNGATANRGLANVLHGEETDKQRRRHNAIDLGFQDERKKAVGQIPGLMNEALNALQGTEVDKAKFRSQARESKAGRLFQQWLSKQQLGQTDRQLDISEAGQNLEMSKFMHQKEIDWANVGISQQGVDAEFARINAEGRNAKNSKDKERAKRKGEILANALERLDNFNKPVAGELQPGEAVVLDPGTNKPNGRKYGRRFDDAYKLILRTPGMTRKRTLEILSKYSTNDAWATEAQKRYKAYYGKNSALRVGGKLG